METCSFQQGTNNSSSSRIAMNQAQPEASSTPSSDEYVVRGVVAEQLPKLWKHGESFVKRALDHANGEMDHHCIRDFCERRQMQLWLIGYQGKVVAAATTEIVCYPMKKVVRVVTLAGKDMDLWAPKLDKMLEEWGLDLGCEGIECYVRAGMTKKLAGLGYNKKYENCYRQIL